MLARAAVGHYSGFPVALTACPQPIGPAKPGRAEQLRTIPVKADLFDYQLPEERIAQYPPDQRDGARMLVLSGAGVEHDSVRELSERIPAGALVVLNETRVRRARLACRRPPGAAGGGGGKVELLLLGPTSEGTWRALGRANRPLREGDRLEPCEAETEVAWLEVVGKEGDGTLVIEARDGGGARLEPERLEAAIELLGAMPIPPYLRRQADEGDVERYQTVFARQLGSAAAPTAGLHLTEHALARLVQRGVEVGRLVLHVGVGTFRPVTADDFDHHDMHAEHVEVTDELVDQVARARRRGAPVVAIGTTVVRALETAADAARPGYLRPFAGATRLLIQPGYRFQVVDALLTNFHMPKSTLLALVCAFAGRERVLRAYAEAVARGYRFLSYGDAMWLPERLP